MRFESLIRYGNYPAVMLPADLHLYMDGGSR